MQSARSNHSRQLILCQKSDLTQFAYRIYYVRSPLEKTQNYYVSLEIGLRMLGNCYKIEASSVFVQVYYSVVFLWYNQ